MANEFVINTKLDAKGIEQGAKKAKAELSRLEKSLDTLKAKEQQMKSAGKDTRMSDEYKKATAEVDRLGKQLSSLYTRQEKLEELGVSKNSRQFKSLNIDIERTATLLREAKAEKERLESSRAVNTDSWNKLQSDISNVESKLAQARANVDYWNQQTASTSSANGGTARMSKALNTAQKALNAFRKALKSVGSMLSKVFSGVGSIVGKATKSLLSFTKAHEKTNASFSKGIKTLLKYSLGIRSMFVLFNKLRSALVDGFKNLAQFNDGLNPVNESLSKLYSGLLYLKNAFATAFAPILTTIQPLLTSLINSLAQASTYVGMLFARVQGQKTFIKAVEVQKNYAESLDKTADKANKAYKSLAKFDELDVYNKDENVLSTDSKNSDNEFNKMFEEVAIPEDFGGDATDISLVLFGKLIKAVNSFKGLVEQYFNGRDWTSIGDTIGEKFVMLFEEIDEGSLGEALGIVINSVLDMVDGFIENHPFQTASDALVEFLNGVINEVDEKKLGGTIGEMVSDIVNAITGFFSNKKMPEDIEKMSTAIRTMIATALDNINWNQAGKSFENVVISIIRGIKAVVGNNPSWWQNIGKKISDAISEIDWEKVSFEMSTLVANLIKSITSFIKGVEWSKVGKAIGDVISGIEWESLWFNFVELCKTIVNAIGDMLKGLLDSDVGSIVAGIIAVLATASALVLASSVSLPGLGAVIVSAIASCVLLSDDGDLVSAISDKITKAISKALMQTDIGSYVAKALGIDWFPSDGVTDAGHTYNGAGSYFPDKSKGTDAPTSANQTTAETQSTSYPAYNQGVSGSYSSGSSSNATVYLSADADIDPLVRSLNIHTVSEAQRVGLNFQKVGVVK